MPWCGVHPGASRNALAVAVVDRDRRGMWGPIYLREIRPPRGRPLDIRNDLVPIGREVRAIGCDSWATDQWAYHDVLHAGHDAGLATVRSEKDSAEHWRHLIAICARSLHALGPSRRVTAEQLEELAAQLAEVQEAFESGGRTIRIPEIGGLHGDLATAYARALWHARAADAQFDEPVNYSRGASEYAGEMSALSDM